MGLPVKILTFLVFCFFSVSVQAEIYKTMDENGNVIYTDMKSRGVESKEVELKPITPIEKPRSTNFVPNSQRSKSPDESEYYSNFEITKPANEATVRNKQHFSVQVMVQPKLQAGHKVRLLLDGEVVETKRGTVFTLENVERGAHTITAELLNDRKNVIKSSSNTVYVHRTIVPQSQNSGP